MREGKAFSIIYLATLQPHSQDLSSSLSLVRGKEERRPWE